jgi:hypothetical protein
VTYGSSKLQAHRRILGDLVSRQLNLNDDVHVPYRGSIRAERPVKWRGKSTAYGDPGDLIQPYCCRLRIWPLGPARSKFAPGVPTFGELRGGSGARLVGVYITRGGG